MSNIYKTIAVCLIIFSALSIANGQNPDVRISKPVVDKDEEIVTVKFRADIKDKAVKRNYSLVCVPQLSDGNYVWSLPAIIVQGKGSKTSLKRQILASDNEYLFYDAVFTKNGSSIDYSASIPYQEWMDGATLTIEAVKAGCCSSSDLYTEILAEDLKLQPARVMEKTIYRVDTVYIVTTTADKLSEDHKFISPYREFEKLEKEGILFNEDRENAINIYFAQSKYNIVEDFSGNRKSLLELVRSVRAIEDSADSEIGAIVIAGFASPEGSYEFNDKLAWNRAVSVKEYIMQRTNLQSSQIKIYNGSTDWQGLRMLVETSDMYKKEAVLDIIDNVPIWDSRRGVGRLGELQRLDGGDPYRYMYKHFFPLLRNSAYIKVYYKNTSDIKN